MATRQVFLPFGAEFPSSNFPQLIPINSRPALAFDASTDETCYWTSIAPVGLTGTLHAIIHYIAASATTGAFRFQAAIEAITPADTIDLDSATSFDTANSNGGTVPGTVGYEQSIDITLTTADSIAAGDYFRLSVNRDADGTSGTDDATGDCYVLAVEFRDAA